MTRLQSDLHIQVMCMSTRARMAKCCEDVQSCENEQCTESA